MSVEQRLQQKKNRSVNVFLFEFVSKMKTTKLKLAEKLKPIVGRKDEIKTFVPILKKLPPLQSVLTTKKRRFVISGDFQRIIFGDFTGEFPKQNSRLFRIFLSSTFSDFKVERNEVYRRVFPSIKQRCAQLGYEFQVVDMRWGVSDTADVDHTADAICLDEIERCIDLSAGLNFIYLVGNRYGYLYVPLSIDEEEFNTILKVAEEENLTNLDLIEKWFQLDQNSVPPKFVYVPVTMYYKNFEEQIEEKKQWAAEEKLLLKALRDAVDLAFQKKKISSEQAEKYFQSITEREIRRATNETNRSNVIGVIRDFTNPIVETAIDAKFFDSTKNERIAKSIAELKQYCAKVTPTKQLRKFVVPWKSGGLNLTTNKSHQEYIDELCKFLTETILQMVETTARRLANTTLPLFHADLLHHASFCREKNQFFFGREELLEMVHQRVELQRRNVSTPLAIVAESGCGKTSFMARLARELRQWYPNSAVIIRFLGTSGSTSNIESVLRSLCTHLTYLYGKDDEEADENDLSLSFSSLVQMFQERLKSVGKKRLIQLKKKATVPKPLFILLDAIDQLEEAGKNSFHFDTWLQRYLPRDVHIFLSFIPFVERLNLRESFLQFVRNDESTLFTVPRLRPNDCEDIIRSSLRLNHRQLNPEQYSYLLTTVENNAKPLYLKLLIDITRTWKSLENPQLKLELDLPNTIEETVEQLFERLEKRHGKEFVQYSLAYLVFGLNGISENELEDCLSINDIVLNEIYAHHDPPIPNAVHVPSLLCQSFLYSIKEYLTRKQIQDKYVLSFYHRKFSESTLKRYAHLRNSCHEDLIEIYSHETTSFQRTILLKKRQNRCIENADRLISNQLTNALNKRKLIALPHHCLQVGSTKDELLREKCLFNFNFLSCQYQSFGHGYFLDLIRHCLRLRSNWNDLKCLYHAICSLDENSSITKDDLQLILAEQILGFIDSKRIKSIYQSDDEKSFHLENLLQQCEKFCNEKENSIRPIFAGFPQENKALAWSFSSVTHILFLNEFFTLVVLDGTNEKNEKLHFIKAPTIALIQLETGKIDKINLDETFDYVWKGHVTKNGDKIYLFGKKSVRIYNSRSGEMINDRSLSWDNKSYCNKAYCITNNEEILVCANEWRINSMDETGENSFYRSGRVPLKHQSFNVENSDDVQVRLRCVGSNDEYVLCLIFDQFNRILLSLWSLNEHEEILPMRYAALFLQTSSMNLFDFVPMTDGILHLTSINGDLRLIDFAKLKSNSKVLQLSNDENIEQIRLSLDQQLIRLVCLENDFDVISTSTSIYLFDRKNFNEILQRIPINDPLFTWQMNNQDQNKTRLITVDSTKRILSIYHQKENDRLISNDVMNIQFRSLVQSIDLIQTTTMLDNDETKKIYALILLDDQTLQLFDTNQLSQTHLQPKGLFSRVKSYSIGDNYMAACEYESPCPLVFSMLMNQIDPPQILQPLENIHVEHIALFDHDRYYVIVNNEKQLFIYAIDNLSQILFQYNFKSKSSSSNLFALETSHPDILILMFIDQILFLVVKFQNLVNQFKILSEQTIVIPKREHPYSLQWTPKRKYLLIEQSLNLEDDIYLNDLRILTCDQQLKISGPTAPISYTKSKTSRGGKVIGFYTYVASLKSSILWIAHQGNILNVTLPSTTAELEIRPDYHSWMRHALSLYQKTTEKSSLAIIITSLAIQSNDDSLLASGGNDGSIVIWTMMNNQVDHVVLESIHNDEITALLFDTNSNRLFSCSNDRNLAIWSSNQLVRVLRVHIPLERLRLLSSAKILIGCGKYWAFDRLMMFFIGTPSEQLALIQKNNLNRELKKTMSIEANEVVSWAL